MSRLIDLSVVHVINGVHPNIQNDIREGEDVPTLRDLKSRQVREAELSLVRQLYKVLSMYESIQEQAVVSRPNDDLESILHEQGIQTLEK